jgi:hypothetical protein
MTTEVICPTGHRLLSSARHSHPKIACAKKLISLTSPICSPRSRPAAKIIRFFGSTNPAYIAPVPPGKRGVTANRHLTRRGMRWTRCAQRRSADRVRRNRAVPIPRRWNQALRDERKATVARKPGTPRRSRISRKPIARGMPVVRLNLCCLRAQCAFLLHARLAGAASTRHSLRPLFGEGHE